MNKGLVFGIIGVTALVGGVIVYKKFIANSEDSTEYDTSTDYQESEEVLDDSDIPTEEPKDTSIRVNHYAPYQNGVIEVSLKGGNRPSPSFARVGEWINIKGSSRLQGNLPITRIWLDANGNIGSIFVRTNYVPKSSIDKVDDGRIIEKSNVPIKVDYLQKSKSTGNIAVHLKPRPYFGWINKGDRIGINGSAISGVYVVQDVWKDSAGNLGAIYISAPNYTMQDTIDKTQAGKGTITKY